MILMQIDDHQHILKVTYCAFSLFLVCYRIGYWCEIIMKKDFKDPVLILEDPKNTRPELDCFFFVWTQSANQNQFYSQVKKKKNFFN